MQHVRDITDPEHPYSLEQLNVVSEDLIDVDDNKGSIRHVIFCGSAVLPRAAPIWLYLQ